MKAVTHEDPMAIIGERKWGGDSEHQEERKKKWPRSEQDIGAAIVAWLQAQYWNVYQEVRVFGYGGPVADIVAVQGKLIWIVECKTSMGLAVLDQAMEWRRQAHFISVASPYHEKARGAENSHILGHVFRTTGIGWLQVQHFDYRAENDTEIHQRFAPALNRNAHKTRDLILQSLHEEQKTAVGAGSDHGGYYTPFKNTCRQVINYVLNHPGAALKDIIQNIDHHYSTDVTARACLARWIQQGIVKGVRAEMQGRKIVLYPESKTQA